MAVGYDPRFLERSPMLAPLRAHAEPLRRMSDWPDRRTLQSLLAARNATTAEGCPLRLVDPCPAPYERQLYLAGELQFRDGDWHDLFNVLAWLRWPLAKRELNRRHYLAARGEGAHRGRVRDALTLFDESGAVVVSSDASLLEAVRAFQWKTVFWDRRAEALEHMRVHVFGHAVMEKALQPYVGLTAHALLIHAPPDATFDDIDALVSTRVGDSSFFLEPQMLAPLPLLGVPGWWPANEHAAFYDDTKYFRRGRRKSGCDE